MIPESLIPLLVGLGAGVVIIAASWALARSMTAATEQNRKEEARLREQVQRDLGRRDEEIGRLAVRVSFLEGEIDTKRRDYLTLYGIAQELRALAAYGNEASRIPRLPPLQKKQTAPLTPIPLRLRREQLGGLQALLAGAVGMDTREGRDQLVQNLAPSLQAQLARADSAAVDLMNILTGVYRAGDSQLLILLRTCDDLFDGTQVQADIDAWWDHVYHQAGGSG